MVNKIKKIKNLGIFSNFKWDENLPNLKRFNLIYGWNGSGKTTLSKLFFALEDGKLDDYPSLEYELETTDGKSFQQEDSFNIKIRVFNQDYVNNNVFPQEKKAKLIYILGEENKKLADQIEKDEKELSKKRDELRNLEKSKSEKEIEKGKKFTDIASLISLNTAGLTSRTYRKPDAEEKFNKLQDKKTLTKEELKHYVLTVGQHEKPNLNLLSIPKFNVLEEKELDIAVTLKKVVDKTNAILNKTVESVIVERLKENNDISSWVEAGIALHDKHKSKTCEFCNQQISSDRIKKLSAHFNEADKKLKDEIDRIVENLRHIYSSIEMIKTIDKANLYEEMQESYQLELVDFEKEKKELLNLITDLASKLKDKKLHTTESVKTENEINTIFFSKKIEIINKSLNKHNKKTQNLKTEKTNAQEQLEMHYLSTIYDGVKELDKNIKALGEGIEEAKNGNSKSSNNLGIIALKRRIDENKIKISSSHKACAEINDNLKAFLGTDELIFEVEKEGYVVKRHGDVAKNLSEGEKTAIAFVYFIIHLRDKDFDLKTGIVVIDDPISSLDSNILFRVGSFIEKKLKTTGQLFILTHNYDFFNQMKKWFYNDLNRDKDSTLHIGSLFMIKNNVDSETHRRSAFISDLDPLLRDYESEYHFLFSKLYLFKDEVVGARKGDILAIYHYPNLARKFLECFLSFRIPKRGTFYSRIISLTELNKDISGTDLGEVYNFVNSHSHLDTKTGLLQFDPTLTLSGDKCIELVLKIIKQADEKHYKAMEKAIKVS